MEQLLRVIVSQRLELQESLGVLGLVYKVYYIVHIYIYIYIYNLYKVFVVHIYMYIISIHRVYWYIGT